MSKFYQVPASPVEDLKVTIQNVSMVTPSQETERRSFFLSNIDRKLNFHVSVVNFHKPHEDFPPLIVAEKLKSGVAQALVAYDFLAGRLKLNSETGRLEIDCNAAGAGFVVASSECSLEDIGDLVYPHPAFAQLTVEPLDMWAKDEQPLFILQVTSFKCGGFAIGTSMNHTAFDGASLKTFLENVWALAANKPLVVCPCNDRRLLAARSPPRVTFLYPENFQLNTCFSLDQDSNNNSNAPAKQEQPDLPVIFRTTQEKPESKLFRLTPKDISNLKDKAKTHENASVSSFNAIVALLWWCKALSSSDDDPDRVCTILYPVNIRSRLIPPLPESYAGNGVMSAYARAKLKELKEESFSRLAELVSEGAKRMTDEHIRSIIDWYEIYPGFTRGDLVVTPLWKLGFGNEEPPWGRSVNVTHFIGNKKDIVLILPDALDDKCLYILASLPSEEADKFESLFRSFLWMETGHTGEGGLNIAHKSFSRI